MLIRFDLDRRDAAEPLWRHRIVGDYFRAKGVDVAFAVPKSDLDLARSLLGEARTLHRLPDDLEGESERLAHLRRRHGHRVLLVDAPKADSAYLFRLRRHFDQLVYYDDGAGFHIHADVLLNPDPLASNHRYHCIPETRLLLGPKFHLCGPAAQSVGRASIKPQRVLLHVGESEAAVTRLLRGLATVGWTSSVDVVCEPEGEVAKVVAASEARALEVARGRQVDDLAYRLVIRAADRRCLDLAHQGVPFATVAVVKSQLETAYALDQKGVAPSLGWLEAKDDASVAQWSTNLLREDAAARVMAGRALVDGRGLDRLAQFLKLGAS